MKDQYRNDSALKAEIDSALTQDSQCPRVHVLVNHWLFSAFPMLHEFLQREPGFGIFPGK